MIASLILLMCFVSAVFYFLQERIIFYPDKLPGDYRFEFSGKYEEMNIATPDGNTINGLLFKADSCPKGLIFFLHGNAGSLAGWGNIAQTFTGLQYDIFMMDYRGFGKSSGKITSEKQFHADVQLAYRQITPKYPEDQVIVMGFSIGTGPAAKLASQNHPSRLVLLAPYYNLPDLARHHLPIIPNFLIKYKFRTNEYLPAIKAPVTVFHGTKDEVIYHESSLKLQKLFKPGDQLILLEGQRHNGITTNPVFIEAMRGKD